tara:strand:- start:345 stop:887 length:543 start_codon:yes stop_codon:yes gene_type:complete
MRTLKRLILIISIPIFLISCGGGLKLPKPGDARNIPSDGRERARKNIEEGRGVSAKDLFGGRGSTNYEFSTSNPLWRATFDVIDFMPLVTVDYSGGMIVTDWYTDSNTTNDSLKFTIRFLSNEIRADSLKIIIHKKTCNLQTSCIVTKITSAKLEDTIRADIIKKAAILDSDSKKRKKKS